MDYNKLANEVLKINKKIRFAGVYSAVTGKVYSKQADGIDIILSSDQTYKALVNGYMRWKTRQKMADSLGEPIYAMAKYPKINRITIRCGKTEILMISTENDLEPHEIIEQVLELLEKYTDQPQYVTAPNFHRYNF